MKFPKNHNPKNASSQNLEFHKVMCVLVGDEQANNIYFHATALANQYPDPNLPITGLDQYLLMKVDNEFFSLTIWRNSSKFDLDCPKMNVFFVLFSLVHPLSLQNVKDLWVPKIRQNYPGVPYILVGSNLEFRDNFEENKEIYRERGYEPIPTSKGEEVKQEIGAELYIEVNLPKVLNVRKCLEEAC